MSEEVNGWIRIPKDNARERTIEKKSSALDFSLNNEGSTTGDRMRRMRAYEQSRD